MQEVKSAAFTHVAHDAAGNVLTIRFNSGKEHQYHNFPDDKFQEFIKADSLGKYYAAKIRNNPEHNAPTEKVA